MNDTHSPGSTTIRARIHRRALDRMPMFFDASVSTAFVELIANARRSAATRVDIAASALGPPNGYRFEVAVRDDGHGIADPAVLLSFGESHWDGRVARSENAAGMGLLCLARYGCHVASRPSLRAVGDAPAWRVELEPDHFTGKADAQLLADDTAPEPHGTCVTFVAEKSLDALRAAAADAARYAPLPVTFDGEELERRDFLDNSIRVERWNGLTLGVRKSSSLPYSVPDINFHGLTVDVRLPHVQTLDGDIWTVRAEVGDCPALELVLPARKEAVENDFLKELRDEARLAVYRALAPMDPPPRMAFDDHARAAKAGIDLPVPPAELWPWRPSIADVDDWTRSGTLTAVGSDALVVEYDCDPPDTQPFYRAAGRAGLTPRLFEPDRRLVGYGWYDAIPRLMDVRTEIEIDGATCTDTELHERVRAATRNGNTAEARRFEAAPSQGDGSLQRDGSTQGDCPPQGDRADAITMHAEIIGPDGKKDFIRIPADIVFLDTAYGLLYGACPVIAAGSEIDAEALTELLRLAYFCASDDCDADSVETQRAQFDTEALHLALKHVASADEATRAAIARAVFNDIHWLMPRDRHVNILVRGDDVLVKLGPPPGS